MKKKQAELVMTVFGNALVLGPEYGYRGVTENGMIQPLKPMGTTWKSWPG